MKARKLSEAIMLALGLVALFHIALADGVRTIQVKPNTIEPIYLSMGKSTVLRFREHPRKIVIGNPVYFFFFRFRYKHNFRFLESCGMKTQKNHSHLLLYPAITFRR